MMIFQSASQEKKEKVAEMVLSSITANDLMQGKIIGYFVLGIFQVTIWLVIALPIIEWRTDIPVFSYLFVPELLLLLLIAIAGYLLFASIFVSIGATVEEINTSSNFQGIIMMLPFIPFILFGPIFADPNGLIAKVGTFFPITAPGVLLIRLSILEEWPWIEILLAIVVLFVSIWLFMKLAGKIFKTGILLYGKNATPQEIWKWIRY
ncbi:ABC transporter permease [Caldalkalibacillus mannanilyticus]|uniref:ABC transporter permease n=1 Tax=Caldalkalibacillus mannanilyticus TaxID=1418 RepID=UPI001F22BE9B|nr:ABC transporter permease [Caldalkalibacillus mannanilyticus]